ncbi:MAG: 2-C-methyl-D-erythritol 2,4-cyclodiphosphate synthase [Clostridiaceae bacterium]|nr:2-C-methyl-D-erythritol 2,4-cyclodiphosphate synthase [Clostridiaceae bacterium]
MEFRCAIGQDSHRFSEEKNKPLVLGGIEFEGKPLLANSDGDVVLHAVTNAISGISGVNILGDIADRMCQQGITDSKEYLKEALKYLDWEIVNLSISIECKTPKISPRIKDMKESLAGLLNISEDRIGITATTGENLTAFGQGLGIQVFCILTVKRSLS